MNRIVSTAAISITKLYLKVKYNVGQMRAQYNIQYMVAMVYGCYGA